MSCACGKPKNHCDPCASSLLFGQCACGAALTVHHLIYECSLSKQHGKEAISAAFEDAVRKAWESRFDTTHAAVLGYN